MRLLRAAILLLALVAPDLARADIGFANAASTCRALVPGQTLVALRQRTRNGVWVYEGDLSNNPPTQVTTATINRDTGATIDVASAPMPADERAATQQTIQRLNYATIDFAQAWQRANAATGRSDTERIDLLYEAGVLAFRASYFATAGFTEVDSITGTIVPLVIPGFGIEPTVSVAEMAGAIAHAQFVAGSGWIVIEASALQRFDGVTVRVLLANRVSGLLMRPEIVQGFYLPSAPFMPLGEQVQRAAAVSTTSPVVCTALGALVAAHAASPGMGANNLALEPRTSASGVTTYEWVTSLVDASEIERDAHTDATVGPQRKAPAFTAPLDISMSDTTRDGIVDARDLAALLAYWGVANPILDVNASGLVDSGDLAVVLSGWTF